jgi:hypothetical protein
VRDDIVIRGYLLSIHEGSAAERVAIGFGSGGGESPGAALGAATFLATANPAGLKLILRQGDLLIGGRTIVAA